LTPMQPSTTSRRAGREQSIDVGKLRQGRHDHERIGPLDALFERRRTRHTCGRLEGLRRRIPHVHRGAVLEKLRDDTERQGVPKRRRAGLVGEPGHRQVPSVERAQGVLEPRERDARVALVRPDDRGEEIRPPAALAERPERRDVAQECRARERSPRAQRRGRRDLGSARRPAATSFGSAPAARDSHARSFAKATHNAR